MWNAWVMTTYRVTVSRPTSTTICTLMSGVSDIMAAGTRVGVNSGIEWELNSIPDSIPGIGLGIGIKKKRIGIELELTKYARN